MTKTANGVLLVRGTAREIIKSLSTPEQCAEFYYQHYNDYGAVREVWEHVRTTLLLYGREKSFPVANGKKVVATAPVGYQYDADVVRELAPEAVISEEEAPSEALRRINELASDAYEALLAGEKPEDELTEIMRLSQPAIVEKVDGRKLAAILGRGDERAQILMERKAKKPAAWKVEIRDR